MGSLESEKHNPGIISLTIHFMYMEHYDRVGYGRVNKQKCFIPDKV